MQYFANNNISNDDDVALRIADEICSGIYRHFAKHEKFQGWYDASTTLSDYFYRYSTDHQGVFN